MEGALPVILEIAVPVLVALIGWVVRQLVKKYKLEEYINQEELIDRLVVTAVTSVEKLARTLETKHSQRLESGEKLAKAISYIRNEMNRLGLTEMAAEVLKARVEAALLQYQI
jgi:hypothetical protein